MLDAIQKKILGLYRDYGMVISLSGIFLIPLKLSLAYIVLAAYSILWLCSGDARLSTRLSAPILAPLLLFLLVSFAGSIFGLEPLHSLPKLAGFILVAFLIPVFCSISLCASPARTVLVLLLGQAVAATHSVLEGAYPKIVPPIFLGKVTESGQLALITVLCAGFIIYSLRKPADREPLRNHFCLEPCCGDLGICVLTTILLIATAFSSNFAWSNQVRIGLLGLSLIQILYFARTPLISLENFQNQARLLLRLILPLLITALLVNLKRGPWTGVLIGSSILVILYGKRYLFPALLGIALIAFAFDPIRSRLLHSQEHFYISGGRAEIWDIGVDLALRYPLGIGFENGHLLSRFSPEIPKVLTHFHNNFINIIVELGWISFFIYLWWIYSILQLAFREKFSKRESILTASIGCAVISWQIAGMVEYNLGDSEVLLLVFVLLGTLVALSEERRVSEPTIRQAS